MSSDAAGPGSGGSSAAESGRGGASASSGGSNPSKGDDCQTELDEPGLCQLLLGCDQATLLVWCSESGTGSWGCSCKFGTTTASYELADQAGIAACRTALGVCSQLPNAEFEEPVCAPVSESSGVNNCSKEWTCDSRARVEPGIDVLRSEPRAAHCKGGGVEPEELVHCACTSGALRAFDVRGFDPTIGCGAIGSLCEQGAELSDVQCETVSSTSSEGSCRLSERCSSSVTALGAEFELFIGGEVLCRDEGARARCVCSGPSAMDFDYTEDGVTLASCDYASEVCRSGRASWEDGLHTCTIAAQSADEAACGASLDCVAEARFGPEDAELRVHGAIQIDCRLDAAAGSAACRCRGVETEQIEVESDDAWGACAQAAEACAERVGPEFAGPSRF